MNRQSESENGKESALSIYCTAQRIAAAFHIRHISLALHLEEGKNLNLEATRL